MIWTKIKTSTRTVYIEFSEVQRGNLNIKDVTIRALYSCEAITIDTATIDSLQYYL